MPVNIQLAADYISFKAFVGGERISVLKLHKLLYYVQAWGVALYQQGPFVESFEAWVHGPVSRDVFDRYKDTKTMYTPIEEQDWSASYSRFGEIPQQARDHIDNVLNSYMHLTGSQLEQLTHQEPPWLNARGNLPPFEKCTTVIKTEDMGTYYAGLLVKQ